MAGFTRSNVAEQFPVADEATAFQNQDPILNPEPVTETETEPKSKKKGKGKVHQEVTPEVAPEVQPEQQSIDPVAEVVVEPTITTIEESTVTEPTAEPEVPEQTEYERFKAMTTEQVWAYFGGEQMRGVISKAIRHLDAVGMPRSEIATKLNKRYQHVRNVLTEPVANKA